MRDPDRLVSDVLANPLAVIVDLDETLCVQFNCPVRAGVEVLRRIDAAKVAVHYVTARTQVSRRMTDKFIADCRLPGGQNVHYSPAITSSREHKRTVHASLAREYRVIASIGDSFEEQEAAAAAGIPFVLVDVEHPDGAWAELVKLVEQAGGLVIAPSM